MPDSATLNDDDRAELEGVDDEGAKEDEEEDEEKLDEEVEVDGCLRSGLLAAAEIAPPDSFASVSFAKHRSQTRTASENPRAGKTQRCVEQSAQTTLPQHRQWCFPDRMKPERMRFWQT